MGVNKAAQILIYRDKLTITLVFVYSSALYVDDIVAHSVFVVTQIRSAVDDPSARFHRRSVGRQLITNKARSVIGRVVVLLFLPDELRCGGFNNGLVEKLIRQGVGKVCCLVVVFLHGGIILVNYGLFIRFLRFLIST